MTGARAPGLLERVKRIIDRSLGPAYPWPGNVRELEQCVRSILLRRDYRGTQGCGAAPEDSDLAQTLVHGIEARSIGVQHLVAGYCRMLYDQVRHL
jgi:transcriptional regulator with PAS, ATPase and Fis domain